MAVWMLSPRPWSPPGPGGARRGGRVGTVRHACGRLHRISECARRGLRRIEEANSRGGDHGFFLHGDERWSSLRGEVLRC